jgi:CDP-paratose 2-epimerase
VDSDPQPRPFDLPWIVLDSRRAEKAWGWQVARPLNSILDEIAAS